MGCRAFSPLGDVEGNTFPISPGSTFAVEVFATNIGNLDDGLSVSATGLLNQQGSDSATDWKIYGENTTEVPVNSSTTLYLEIEAPFGSWNGTTYQISASIVAFDVEIQTFTFTLVVSHVAGWNAMASNADLEIDPFGSTVSLTVVQKEIHLLVHM